MDITRTKFLKLETTNQDEVDICVENGSSLDPQSFMLLPVIGVCHVRCWLVIYVSSVVRRCMYMRGQILCNNLPIKYYF